MTWSAASIKKPLGFVKNEGLPLKPVFIQFMTLAVSWFKIAFAMAVARRSKTKFFSFSKIWFTEFMIPVGLVSATTVTGHAAEAFSGTKTCT